MNMVSYYNVTDVINAMNYAVQEGLKNGRSEMNEQDFKNWLNQDRLKKAKGFILEVKNLENGAVFTLEGENAREVLSDLMTCSMDGIVYERDGMLIETNNDYWMYRTSEFDPNHWYSWLNLTTTKRK